MSAHRAWRTVVSRGIAQPQAVPARAEKVTATGGLRRPTQPGTTTLTGLIYASEITLPLTASAVQDIVDKARTANQRRHLTGMLAFDSRSFLQVLEGRRAAVSEVFCRIVSDPRHQHVQLLELAAVDERLFAGWSMGFATADAHGRDTFLRFSGVDQFAPSTMTAGSALGLLRGLAAR